MSPHPYHSCKIISLKLDFVIFRGSLGGQVALVGLKNRCQLLGLILYCFPMVIVRMSNMAGTSQNVDFEAFFRYLGGPQGGIIHLRVLTSRVSSIVPITLKFGIHITHE